MTIGIARMSVLERLSLRSEYEEPDFSDPLVRLDRDSALPCRTCQGERTKNGYGRIRIRGNKVCAHRAAYEESHGPLRPSDRVDHLCRNKPCWEPTHLEAVSHAENVRRGTSGLWGSECGKGHPFDETNTYIYRGNQYCKTCRAENSRRWANRTRINRAAEAAA